MKLQVRLTVSGRQPRWFHLERAVSDEQQVLEVEEQILRTGYRRVNYRQHADNPRQKLLCSDCQEHKHRDDFAKRQRDRSAKKCLCCAAKIEVEAQEGKTIRLATARIKTFGTTFVPPPPRDLQPGPRDAQPQTAAVCHDLIIKEWEGRRHKDWYFQTKAVVYPWPDDTDLSYGDTWRPGFKAGTIREQVGDTTGPWVCFEEDNTEDQFSAAAWVKLEYIMVKDLRGSCGYEFFIPTANMR